MVEGCGKEFVDETDNDVTCGVETDYWDEENKEVLWRTPICSKCKDASSQEKNGGKKK